jgi:pilus assembly protein CpaB
MVFRLAIFGLLIVGLIAVSWFGISLLDQPKPQPVVAAAPAPPPTTQILVAADPVGAGALLQPTDVTSAPVPVGAVPVGASLDTPDNRSALIGSMIRVSVGAGAPILDSQVIHPGDHGFLAAVLAPGMRAVTVAVDNVTGANGLIWPGDNVDVLLTQTIAGAPGSKSIAAEVVLNDVRVIATGAELIKNAAAGPAGGPPAQTVTLEVTPNQASRCLVATNLGRLSLIVHSSENVAGETPGNEPVAQPVWAGDVSPALTNQGAPSAPVATVKVFQGSPSEQDYSF